MAKKTFEINRVTKGKEEGIYFLNLVINEETEFGPMPVESYSLKARKEFKLNDTVEVEMSNYDVMEHEHTITNSAGQAEKRKKKWLHRKQKV